MGVFHMDKQYLLNRTLMNFAIFVAIVCLFFACFSFILFTHSIRFGGSFTQVQNITCLLLTSSLEQNNIKFPSNIQIGQRNKGVWMCKTSESHEWNSFGTWWLEIPVASWYVFGLWLPRNIQRCDSRYYNSFFHWRLLPVKSDFCISIV